MNNQTEQQLSSELQELYLENKQWLSDVLFLEDEAAFFQKLFESVLSSAVKANLVTEILFINASLRQLEERRKEQKDLILKHQYLLENLIKDQSKKISLDLIIDNKKIIEEIKSLFISEKLLKKEPYILVETIIQKNKASHLLTD